MSERYVARELYSALPTSIAENRSQQPLAKPSEHRPATGCPETEPCVTQCTLLSRTAAIRGLPPPPRSVSGSTAPGPARMLSGSFRQALPVS
jgi:hypothetical protein